MNQQNNSKSWAPRYPWHPTESDYIQKPHQKCVFCGEGVTCEHNICNTCQTCRKCEQDS